jgi:predicted metal-dependent hydrolase
VRLVVSSGGELTVVVPRRFDGRAIPGLVEAKLPWIERARARMEARPLPESAASPLPECILLPALGEEWEVEYRSRPATAGAGGRRLAVARETRDGRLVVTGPADDEDACRRA